MSSNTSSIKSQYLQQYKCMWEGKVAFITGAGEPKNIGGTTAIAFAERGVQVVIMDRSNKGFPDLEAAITAAGGKKPLCLTGDVSNPLDCQKAVDLIETKLGRLDFAFNNAGIPQATTAINKIETSFFDDVQKVNLNGIFYCLRAEINLMLKLKTKGAIVNTASVYGLRGALISAEYCASKFGVVGLSLASALDMAKENIRINAICPGAVQTPLLERIFKEPAMEEQIKSGIPTQHFVDAREIAEGVLFLCQPNMPSLTGITLTIDGGMTAAAG